MYAYKLLTDIERYYNAEKLERISETRGNRYSDYRNRWDDKNQVQFPYEKPLEIMLEITSWCNYSCKMCPHNYELSNDKINMPLSTVTDIAKQIKMLHVDSIWLGSFSECLIHPQIIDILDVLGEAFVSLGEGADFYIITNGSRLTNEIAEKIISIGVTNVFVSLDAATQETYSTIRGGNLNAVESNINNLLTLRGNNMFPIIRVSMVKLPENISEREMFRKKWEGKVDIIDFQTLQDYDNLEKDKSVERYNTECLDPFRRLFVRYDGKVLPCCTFYAIYHEIGNVYESTLMEIWKGKRLAELRESLRTGNLCDICKKCKAIKE